MGRVHEKKLVWLADSQHVGIEEKWVSLVLCEGRRKGDVDQQNRDVGVEVLGKKASV